MKILITGIGCIGKSTVRKRAASRYPDIIFSIDLETDMNHSAEPPIVKKRIVLVESIHGLVQKPKQYDRILYLLPPKNHTLLWFKRGWRWFSTGTIDFPNPRGKRKPYALSNIPSIMKVLLRNIKNRKKWVKEDLEIINEQLKGKTYVASSATEGYRMIESWIINHANFDNLCKKVEVK